MRLFSFCKVIIAIALILLVGAGTYSQTGNTLLRGTVLDPKGASVPDATVTLTNAELGITLTVKTDKDGAYQFLEIRPSTYVLTVTAPGFANYRQTGLVLLVATPTTNDVKMQLAGVATTVEVVTMSQTINTQDATIGNAFNQTQISALPFEGRDPTAILSLQPGVVTIADRDQVDLRSDSRGGAVNGARSDQTNVTLDGVDNNDQLKGLAFTGALRATLDSVEEFRVTTTNAGADQGRSSGAQVQLLTKSGTNQLHGTAYEYNRPTNMVANDYFNKHSELQNGEPNVRPRLLRNTFGGTFGGPIKKDRLFYFIAYEGQRTRESKQVTREVPSTLLREGMIQYQCADPTQCPGGTLQIQGVDPNFLPKTYTVNVPAGSNVLSTPQIASMDPNCSGNETCPQGPGVNPAIIQTLNQYPTPNSNQLGYGYNFQAFTFSSPAPNKLDTYIAKFDYNLNQSGTQRLFARLEQENDHAAGVLWFPGQPPAGVDTNNSKGIVAGYVWTINSTKVNNLHYGFIRQGFGNNGSSQTQFVFLRGLATPTSDTRSTNVIVPVHNVTDDFSWTRGKHTWQFGGNWRFLNNIRSSDAQSFSDAITNTGFLPTTGFAGRGISLDPGCFTENLPNPPPPGCTWNFPQVDKSARNAYDFPMAALAGIITEVDATYQRDKNGNLLADPTNPGAFIHRHFRANEAEFYFQDSYRLKSNLTVNYGLRYSLLQPPYEVNGNQVTPNISLDQFFNTRMSDMVNGTSYSPLFSLDLGGSANGKKPYWAWDYKNLAPRISLAYSPGFKEGLLGSVFGGPGKSSIRIGAGVYYDHFGQGIVNTFDRNGSFGLTTTIADAPGTVNVDTAPRYSGLSAIPGGITPPGPTGPFPVQPPTADQLGGFAIYWGLDDKLKTPYSYAIDLSFSRELKGGFVVEAAYVGRISRRLLQEKDLAQPQNLKDPKTGLSYFQALTGLAQVYRTGLTTDQFAANPGVVDPKVIQYWQDMMQPVQTGGSYLIGPNSPNGSCGQLASTTSAAVAAYDVFCAGSFNETTPLFFIDLFGIPDATNDPNCGQPTFPTCVNYFPKNGRFSFYQSQFASLYSWASGGRANYNAGQFSLRHRASHGLTFDFNYTYSKSIDFTSDAERVNLFEGYGFGGGQIINSFDPAQARGVSDYDMTHQFNTNWVYELPFGRGMKWGHDWNRGLDALLGGWSFSGLARWSSGLPFIVQNGFDFPTNWELNGFAVLQGSKPKTGVYTDCGGDPNIFAALQCNNGVGLDPGQFILGQTGNDGTWRFPYPGEAGNRNNIRGPGYFGIDVSVRKSWKLTERTALAFSGQAYNVTNSVRFDAANAFPTIDSAGSFGKYSNTLTRSRVLEFMLRLTF